VLSHGGAISTFRFAGEGNLEWMRLQFSGELCFDSGFAVLGVFIMQVPLGIHYENY